MASKELAAKLIELFSEYVGTDMEPLLEDGVFIQNRCAENGIDTEGVTDKDWEEAWDLFDLEMEKLSQTKRD